MRFGETTVKIIHHIISYHENNCRVHTAAARGGAVGSANFKPSECRQTTSRLPILRLQPEVQGPHARPVGCHGHAKSWALRGNLRRRPASIASHGVCTLT